MYRVDTKEGEAHLNSCDLYSPHIPAIAIGSYQTNGSFLVGQWTLLW